MIWYVVVHILSSKTIITCWTFLNSKRNSSFNSISIRKIWILNIWTILWDRCSWSTGYEQTTDSKSVVMKWKWLQWVLVYRDDWVQKFQKIPIIEFSGSLINLINLVYRDFPGKIPVFEFFWENPGKSRYSRLIRLISDQISGFFEKIWHTYPDIQGPTVITHHTFISNQVVGQKAKLS